MIDDLIKLNIFYINRKYISRWSHIILQPPADVDEDSFNPDDKKMFCLHIWWHKMNNFFCLLVVYIVYCPRHICIMKYFLKIIILTIFSVSDPAHDVLPRGVQGGVDVPGGDLHAPREHRLQDLPRPRGDCWHQEIRRFVSQRIGIAF